MNRSTLAATAFAAAVVLPGCATTQGANPADPLEPMNRAVFAFNEAADKAVVKPVAQAYDTVVPELFRFLIGNFFSNLGDVWTSVNQLLQGKPREAVSDAARVLINSTLGFAGVADPASEMGFEKHREDFGQTLGRWGVGSGPYLVLPILGPSSLRDGAGLVADYGFDPIGAANSEGVRNNAYLLRAIDTRASLLQAEKVVEGAALDKYSFIRDGYLQRRKSLIWDGDPPASDDDESWYQEDEEGREATDSGKGADAGKGRNSTDGAAGSRNGSAGSTNGAAGSGGAPAPAPQGR